MGRVFSLRLHSDLMRIQPWTDKKGKGKGKKKKTERSTVGNALTSTTSDALIYLALRILGFDLFFYSVPGSSYVHGFFVSRFSTLCSNQSVFFNFCLWQAWKWAVLLIIISQYHSFFLFSVAIKLALSHLSSCVRVLEIDALAYFKQFEHLLLIGLISAYSGLAFCLLLYLLSGI